MSEKEQANAGPSETALITASTRALAYYDEREEIRCGDKYAELFLTEDRKAAIKNPHTREWIRKSAMPPGLYEYIIARTAFIDDIFRNMLLKNISQIVILGAGYDSRALLFAENNNSTIIYELDAKPTQERKIKIIKENNFLIPDSVRYVPIDFESESLEKTLVEAGYNKNLKTLFIWEGVTFYLSEDAVNNVMASIRDNSPAESILCFDFQTYLEESKDLVKTEIPAEQIKFGIREGGITEFLNNRGFKIIQHSTSADMEKRYLTLKDGSIAGSISPKMNLVSCYKV
ncbi:MAG TPA: SAM-dependent methyltransferase [Clostridia bacterium]|nr:SAM-dependent methyltransferase [Clostridia bacterium]